MNHLTRTLGPAPSELPTDVFVGTRLRAERQRIEASLQAFRSGTIPTWEKRKARAAKPSQSSKRVSKAAREVASLLSAANISREEIKRLILEERKSQNV